MKIKKKHHKIVIPFFMSLFVSFIVTTTVTLMNLGTDAPALLTKILSAWSTAFPIAFISLFFVRPLVEKTVHAYTE